jgi:transposase InsO family protein
MKYQFIQVHRGQFPLGLLLRVLQVSSSAYHAWRQRPLSLWSQRDAELIVQIREIYQKSESCYGSPRVHRELQAQGIRCGQKRVARLMQAHDLVAQVPRRFVVTTDSKHILPVAANQLDQQYQETVVSEEIESGPGTSLMCRRLRDGSMWRWC